MMCWCSDGLAGDTFNMCRLRIAQVLKGAVMIALLVCVSPPAQAEDACSDPAVKDVFLQGGEQVLEEKVLREAWGGGLQPC